MKFILTKNYDEYAVSIHDNLDDAIKGLAELIRKDENISDQLDGSENDEEVIDMDGDGYYRIIELRAEDAE